MDNQKDFYIKEKLQKDKLISKKADDVFNNFLKGDFFMNEEINLEKANDKKLDTKEESNTKEQNNIKVKRNKSYKNLVATAASVLVLFCAANVYAMTQGYENIFFMIKYLTTGEQTTISDKNEILSDRDMTISYEPIKITDNIRLQVKNLQTKDNEAKLFLVVNEDRTEENENIVPLNYKVYNLNGTLLCSQDSSKDLENAYGNIMYTEELVLKNLKESDEILKLEIYKSDSKLITKIKIDLESRTIEVEGEEEALEKISEIELKEFLGYPSLLYDVNGNMVNDDCKVWVANITAGYMEYVLNFIEFDSIKVAYENGTAYGFKVDDINFILDSVYGVKIEDFKDDPENDFFLHEEDGVKYFVTTYAGGLPDPAECIDVTNISYCGGLYTVTYTYCDLGGYATIFDVDINDYDIYEHTITFELNEDEDKKEISKFRMVSSKNPVIIKAAEDKEEGEFEGDVVIPTVPDEDKIPESDSSYSEQEVVKLYFEGKWRDTVNGEVLIIKDDMRYVIEYDGSVTSQGKFEVKDYGSNDVPHILIYDNADVYDFKLIQGSKSYLVSDDVANEYEWVGKIDKEDLVDNDSSNSNTDKKIVEEYFSGKWYGYFSANVLKINNDMTFTIEENNRIIDRGTIELKYYNNSGVPHIIFKYDNGNVFDYERVVTGEVSLQSRDNDEVYEARTKENDDSANNKNEIKVDNYASTMSWTEYYAPGIKIKYPTIFDLEEIGGSQSGNRSGEISTLITGIATGVDPNTKEIINSNMTIKIYEPTYKTMSMEEIEELNKMCKYTRADGVVWYEDYKPDGNGGATYTHTSYTVDTSNPTYSAWEHKVVFEVDVDANYKVINIINWFLKSTDFISY